MLLFCYKISEHYKSIVTKKKKSAVKVVFNKNNNAITFNW